MRKGSITSVHHDEGRFPKRLIPDEPVPIP